MLKKSLFVKNSSKYGHSLINSGSAGDSYSYELMLIHKLTIHNSIKKITDYYTNFSLGKFDSVVESLTQTEFRKISTALYGLKKNKRYKIYEFILANLMRSFESLMQSVYQYVYLQVTEDKLEEALKKAGILDDMVLLEQYCTELREKMRMKFIPDVSVAAPMFSLRPEYETYIRMYGFPEGGVFRSDLLGEIISKMM